MGSSIAAMSKLLSQRWPWIAAASVVLLLWGSTFVAVQLGDADPRPLGSLEDATALLERADVNVLFILIDTLRADHLGAYGYERETSPVLDLLASRGVRFANHIAQSSWTLPSMASLMTSLHPPLIPAGSPVALDPSALPLAELLRERGYDTVSITTNPYNVEPVNLMQGFDSRRLRVAAPASWVVDRTLEYLAGRTREKRARPLFAYLHFMDVHDFNLAGISYPDGVNRADAGVGQLLELLEEKGLLENSLVVLTSDHGERLGEKHPVEGLDQHFGNPAFDYLLRVPLISAPGLLKNPASVARGQDLASLILARAGVVSEAPAPVQPADEVFLSEWEWQTLRSGRWKAAFRRDGTRALLFDLKEDAGETSDLSLEHPEILKRMRDRLSELTQEFSAASAPVRMNPEDIKRLRAIGYIEALNAAGPQAPE